MISLLVEPGRSPPTADPDNWICPHVIAVASVPVYLVEPLVAICPFLQLFPSPACLPKKSVTGQDGFGVDDGCQSQWRIHGGQEPDPVAALYIGRRLAQFRIGHFNDIGNGVYQ